jgi:NADPH-dependent glutamate synthase beta subunit-like oxidoreductase
LQRADWDEPVSICSLKRFAYDAGLERDTFQTASFKWDEKVAIVGAGPAGLTTAYQLLREGYHVSIFDSLPVAGGMLKVGIPTYRLPRDVLEHEINYICSLGADVHLSTPVGREGGPNLEDLRQQFDAVFLAVGAHGSSLWGAWRRMKASSGLTFLRDLNLGLPIDIGKRGSNRRR